MVLLIGGYGYVGSAFQRELNERGEQFRVLSRRDTDYYQTDKIVAAICDSNADFVINAAGYTGKPTVDACESHKHECLLGNAVLPGIVREACEQTSTPWGHVSSGCIYQGNGPDGKGFAEDDSPNFCFRTNNGSFYSGTKALGEEVLKDAPHCYLWRLRIPFDHRHGPRNYLSKLMQYDRLLDATNSISHLDDFVSACVACRTQSVPFGVYNVTNTGSVTTREVVCLIREHLAVEKEFSFFTDEEEFMREAAIAPRSNCIMDNTKLLRTGIQMPEVKDALRRALKNWIEV